MFTFEIFTLNKDTLCHEREIFMSITPFRNYDDMKRIAIAKGIELSKEYPTEIIEVNLWDFEAEEWTEEFSYLNGKEYEV